MKSTIHNYIVILSYAYMEISTWCDLSGSHSVIRRTVDLNNVVWC